MSGNWIAVDHELSESPQVLGIIERTGEESATIVGRLVMFWCMADRQTTDGVLPHVGLKSLARQCGGTPEFWQAVVDVGWLVADSQGITIPRFIERFGESARKRMLDAKSARARRTRNDIAEPQGENSADSSATGGRQAGDDSATGARRVDDATATECRRDTDDSATPQPQPQPQPPPPPQSQKPSGIGGRGVSKKNFGLPWDNAKNSDFKDPQKIQAVYEAFVSYGLCSPEERIHLFRFVLCLTNNRKVQNVAGTILSCIRDGKGSDPWRARGGDYEEAAREMIRRLDVPQSMQQRTSDLSVSQDFNAEKDRQRAAAAEREARKAKA